MLVPQDRLRQHRVVRRLLLFVCIAMTVACSGSKPTTAQPQPEPAADPEPEREMYVPPTALSGPPDAPGKLPMADVQLHMGDALAAIKSCAETTTYEGKVTVRVTILPSGEASAELTEASDVPEIDNCMLGAFGDSVFPTSERGQRFVYSYSF